MSDDQPHDPGTPDDGPSTGHGGTPPGHQAPWQQAPGPGQPYPPPGYPAYGPPPGYPPQGPPPGYPPYGAPPYGAPAPGYAVPAQKNSSATTSLVLGIVAVAGTMVCLVGAVVGPVAWIIGVRARREIDSQPGRYGNRGEATAGIILGIVATVLLVLLVIGFVLLIVLLATTEPTMSYDEGPSTPVWAPLHAS